MSQPPGTSRLSRGLRIEVPPASCQGLGMRAVSYRRYDCKLRELRFMLWRLMRNHRIYSEGEIVIYMCSANRCACENNTDLTTTTDEKDA